MDDDELNRLAAAELLREASRGEARAQVAGSMAWLPGTVPSADKRFLANTLRHTLAANRVRDRRDGRAAAAPRSGPGGTERPPRTADRPSDGGRPAQRRTGGPEDSERTGWASMKVETVRRERAEESERTEQSSAKTESVRRGRAEEERLSDDRTRKVNSGSDEDGRCLVKKVKR